VPAHVTHLVVLVRVVVVIHVDSALPRLHHAEERGGTAGMGVREVLGHFEAPRIMSRAAEGRTRLGRNGMLQHHRCEGGGTS